MTIPTDDQTRRARPGAMLLVLLAAIAFVAIAGPIALLHFGPRVTPHRPNIVVPHRVLTQAEVPNVDPVAYQNLSPDDARSYNAGIPFVDGPIPAARPFHFQGSPDDVARATDCLAAAVLYEAGDDSVGMKAVAQVILNRLRHPAFPKTVCGVVFQGSERTTGCQFTFTCDGALAHRWSDAAWGRARDVAKTALDGAVDRTVGYATHYHTDWVVPYWSASLDKLAAVHTHLFYRWTGWWGTPPAFNRQVQVGEPVIEKLAMWSDAHKMGNALDQANAAIAEAAAAAADTPVATATDPNSFVMTLSRKLASPEAFPTYAQKVCGDRAYCKLMAWSDAKLTPSSPTLDPRQIASMSFSYLRDRAHNYEKALWNCKEFKRDDPQQCMKAQILVPQPRIAAETAVVPATSGAIPASATPKPIPEGLTGVHRRGEPAAVTPPPVVPTASASIHPGAPAKAGAQDDPAQRLRP